MLRVRPINPLPLLRCAMTLIALLAAPARAEISFYDDLAQLDEYLEKLASDSSARRGDRLAQASRTRCMDGHPPARQGDRGSPVAPS
jgi:hypothetical protein